MEPLISGATLGLPIVDADGIGRAFPELQMTLPFVYGSSSYPATLGDEKEKVVAVTYAESPKHLENFFRQKTVDMGSVLVNIKRVTYQKREGVFSLIFKHRIRIH